MHLERFIRKRERRRRLLVRPQDLGGVGGNVRPRSVDAKLRRHAVEGPIKDRRVVQTQRQLR